MNAIKSIRENQRGSALVSVVLLSAVASAFVGSYLAYSSQAARATRREIDYQSAQIAAESALEYGVTQMRKLIIDHQFTLTPAVLQDLIDQIPAPPAVPGYSYTTPKGQSAFRISVDTSVTGGVITNGAACLGQQGEYQMYTVTVGALNPATGVGAVLQQRLQGVGLYLIRYAVFYEDDLEINPGAAMTICGPVHCNGDVYLAPDGSTLAFNDRVTAKGDMYRHRKDSATTAGTVTIRDLSSVDVPMTVDSSNPSWMTLAIQKWQGRVLSKAHGVQHLSPPIEPVDVPHDIVERSLNPLDPLYHEQTELEKFNHKACLVLHALTNGVLTAIDCRGTDYSCCFTNVCLTTNGTFGSYKLYKKDAKSAYLFRTNGIYDVTQRFCDKRELKEMAPLDIYVDQLMTNFPSVSSTNYTVAEGRGVIYVTRDDPDGPGVGVQPCVRLRNGRKLPFAGLTFASDLPIYVEGDYNVTNTQPALVTGDAVTFLSKSWQDGRSWSSTLSDRTATSTTYCVVIMTGNSATSWGAYNGGIENVLRFLENWTSKTVTYKGAIIDLWQAEQSTNAWSYGSFYTAPVRDWGYDTMYQSDVPPGMTRVFGMEEIAWNDTTWAQAGWP